MNIKSNVRADKIASELLDIFSPGTVISFLIGLLLVAFKEIIPFVGHLSQEVGYALMISVFVGVVVERRHRKRWDQEMTSRMEEISDNVFSGVFQAELPPNLVRETIAIGLRQKIVREGFDVTYTLKDASYTNENGDSVPYVKLEAETKFLFKNIGMEDEEINIGVLLPDPIAPELRKDVHVSCFEINGIPMDQIAGLKKMGELNDELQQNLSQDDRRDGSYVQFFAEKGHVIAPRGQVHINCHYIMAKEIEDTEFLRSLYPSDGITVTVVDTNPNSRIIDAHSVHPGDFSSAPENGQPKAVYKWKIERYLLPHQGVMFWWKKRKL